MKVIFGINHPAANTDYIEYAKVAIHTARQVGYDPVLLYDGEVPPIEVEKIAVRSRFAASMEKHLCEDEYRIAAGAMLRLEIPNIFADEFVLYADLDTVFHKQLPAPEVAWWGMVPKEPKMSYCNSGVAVMNLPNLRTAAAGFDSFAEKIIRGHQLAGLVWDQGLINIFYKGQITRLPQVWNWRPYWGPNEDAVVLHFHGPKPLDSQARVEREYPARLRPDNFYAEKEKWLALWRSLPATNS